MDTTTPHPPTTAPVAFRRRLSALLGAVVFVAVVAAWAVLLRPQAVGGETAYVIVSGRSMNPGLEDGTLAIVRRQTAYGVGDVVVYRVPEGNVGAGALVIHRIVGGSSTRGYVTRGDNREATDRWRPRPSDMVGRVRLSVPKVGLGLALLNSPLGLAAFAGLVAVALAFPSSRRR